MTRPPAVMIQGTESNVGKSMIVAGLARAFVRRGLKVMPFKPKNISNNAAVTIDGGEIGRAQALQAKAAGVEPCVHMNPVLLKPETDTGAQVIVQGARIATSMARDYGRMKADLLPKVLESFACLEGQADLLLVEGSVSLSETNLRAGDIANMGFAEAADVPVVLIGDIDRGGVIAALVGTHCVLEPQERSRIKGFLINKFRGDISLRTGWQALGTIPWFPHAADLPAEDVLGLTGSTANAPSARAVKVAVPVIGRIANFDDLDPLRMEAGVEFILVKAGKPLPGDADLVLLHGSKSTVADLAFFRAQGWDVDLAAHHRRGGAVLGICGGYQMLGRNVADPQGVEGAPGVAENLGLLDVETVLSGDKTLSTATGRHMASDTPISGYKIHLGTTSGADCARPLIEIECHPDGAISADGLVDGNLSARSVRQRRVPGNVSGKSRRRLGPRL